MLLVVATAALGRLEFEVGSAFTVPTQLLFVPMLFVVPPTVVPLAVASALLVERLPVERLPAILAGRYHPQRVVMVLGDAWFSVGPALVFTLAHLGPPSLSDWPFYLLALAAQFAGDLGGFLLRLWLGHGSPRGQLRVPREVWLVDLLLSPVGLLAAYATVQQPRACLLALPLVALLAFFARERRDRIDNAID